MGIAYLSEDRKRYGLALGLDLETNIALASFGKFLKSLGRVDPSKTKVAAEQRVEELDIKTPGISQKARNLSGGNQQRVVLANALSCGPKVLVATQPTRGLDVGAVEYVSDRLRAAADEGIAVLLISTDLGEIAAMYDVPAFIEKGQKIYGYPHFVNDVGGSLCELEEPGVIDLLVRHSLILYIQVTDSEEEDKLIRRAQSDPKPLYYRPAFLDEQLAAYLREQGQEYAAEMDPDAFTRWVFPRLFRSRVPRYEAIAGPHGYTVTSREVSAVRDESDFLALLETAIARAPGH